MGKAQVHSVRYNFVMNFLLTASSFIFPLITFPYVSRVLGAAGNGKVAFVASVANYFSLVASLGIPTYGVRACARVRDDKDELSQTAQELLIINAITTSAVLITYTIAACTVPRFAQERMLFAINGVNIVLNMLGMNWLFQALEQYDYITARSIGFKALSIVLMFLLVHSPEDYVVYGAISVFAAVGSNVLNSIRSRTLISYKKRAQYNLVRHLRPIAVLSAQSIAVSIYANLDIVMLGFIKDADQVGYYNAAMRVKSLLLSLVTSLANVLLPRMSYYVKEGLFDQFCALMGKAIRFTVMLSAPLCAFFACFAKDSLLFFAGEGYLGAVAAMQAIVLAVLPNGLTGVLGIQVLVPLERERELLISVVVGAVTDFGLNLVLIPLMGATGAAIATTIAETAVLVVQVYYCRELLSKITWKKCSIRCVSAAIISCFPALLFARIVPQLSIVTLMVGGITFFTCYLTLLVFLHDQDALGYLSEIRIALKKLRNKAST